MRALPFLVALAFASGASHAQTAELTILVRDAETAAPLPGATLTVAGLTGAADDFGRAELVGVDLGTLRVGASQFGYVAADTVLTIDRAEPIVVVLALAPDIESLGGVTVEATTINDEVLERRGFFSRREREAGTFITREELDQRGANQFADVFRGVAGVRVQATSGGTSLVSSRRRGCLMQMYLDGTEMTYLAQNINAVPFDDIAAVEIYNGPSRVPVEYTQTKSQETCGAVLVWTRIVASND